MYRIGVDLGGTEIKFGLFESINWYMTYKKEFRNLIQHRLKNPSRSFIAWVHFAIARILWKPVESLYILNFSTFY